MVLVLTKTSAYRNEFGVSHENCPCIVCRVDIGSRGKATCRRQTQSHRFLQVLGFEQLRKVCHMSYRFHLASSYSPANRNLFGQEYCKIHHPRRPTKEEVTNAFESLSPTEKNVRTILLHRLILLLTLVQLLLDLDGASHEELGREECYKIVSRTIIISAGSLVLVSLVEG